ncbi:toll/interleukin-1 receptor domain-containing protein [Salinimonas sp. HHU 13199]|uniref:Toll/interleukin-1 receptor domain-containing protein n=1 Tax=Salinimonas profundi TaxID=2729140 RepID=A0ABR8LRA1_9ALTE|nr:toll/interleukin-1 receptor domain-containing protein [Salinimonas profundi]MBD3587441.1 toll/interleukin-1 receptor domain-containing protein [Salinimonas profundi]
MPSQAQIMRQIQQKLERAAREQQRRIDQHNRKVVRENKKAVDDYNREVRRVNSANQAQVRAVNNYNKNVELQNKANLQKVQRFNTEVNRVNNQSNSDSAKLLADIKRQLRNPSSSISYSQIEENLADRVYEAVSKADSREYDVFLSYAKIDGYETASKLKDELEKLGVSVWFDEVAIIPGKSQSLQMDAGLKKARAGIALLTPAYLAGRFWTERELGVLLNKETLIPVLNGCTFEDVREYSGILPDLAGFIIDLDQSTEAVALKIAPAVKVVEST